MTKIKLCGLFRPCDIEAANMLNPEYIGFVFAPKSKRYISPTQAEGLKRMLSPEIQAVGVFVDEQIEVIADLLSRGTIDMIQLHGNEDEEYIGQLRHLTDKPIIKAFSIAGEKDLVLAKNSSADHVLLDSGAGTGKTFGWELIQDMERPFFLAGGMSPGNVEEAVARLRPFAVDVSSGIETNGLKDKAKMAEFVFAVRQTHKRRR